MAHNLRGRRAAWEPGTNEVVNVESTMKTKTSVKAGLGQQGQQIGQQG